MRRVCRGGRFVAAAALSLAAVACGAKTKFHSAWKAPEAQPLNFKGQKVAAVVVSPNPEASREAEGLLARELTSRGVTGIPAYELLPAKEPRDKEKAKAVFDEKGIVGAVVMRAGGGAQRGVTATSGGYWTASHYGTFWGGAGGYWAYDPSYLKAETRVLVETLVYDVKADKLVFVALSETTNPSGIDGLIKNLAAGAAGQMRKQGLIR